MDEPIHSKRRKTEWSLQMWQFSQEAGPLYPSRSGATYDWNDRRSPGDLVARPRDSPEPGANENPILRQNLRLLRREEADSSTVWLRWEGELASSSSSTTPSLSQSNHELQAGRPIEDIRRGDESLASGSTDARRMGVLTHGNPEFDFTPSGSRYPVLWEGAVVELDLSLIHI